jgi:hypothetical protein
VLPPCVLGSCLALPFAAAPNVPPKAAGSSIDAVAPCSESRQQPCTTLQGVLRRLPRSARAINLISRSLKSFSSHFPFLNLPSPKVPSPATNPQRVANISRQLFPPGLFQSPLDLLVYYILLFSSSPSRQQLALPTALPAVLALLLDLFCSKPQYLQLSSSSSTKQIHLNSKHLASTVLRPHRLPQRVSFGVRAGRAVPGIGYVSISACVSPDFVPSRLRSVESSH